MSNYTKSDLEQFPIKSAITFGTVSEHDNVQWTGTIVGFTNYQIAKTIQDIDPYYADVKKDYPNMAPRDELTYMLLSVTESGATVTRVFATEWIDYSTLERLNTDRYFDIRLHEVEESVASTILNMLRQYGYRVEIVAKNNA